MYCFFHYICANNTNPIISNNTNLIMSEEYEKEAIFQCFCDLHSCRNR